MDNGFGVLEITGLRTVICLSYSELCPSLTVEKQHGLKDILTGMCKGRAIFVVLGSKFFGCRFALGGVCMDFLSKVMAGKKIGASIRRVEDLEEAVRHPNIRTIFLLGGDINFLPAMVKRVRAADKVLLVHIDLIEGVGKDRAGIHLLKRMGVQGIVTTKSSLVKFAIEEEIWVVQRLFIVDSESVKTAIRVAGNVKPTAVEVLPATIPRYFVEEMKKNLGLTILGGGLLRTEADVKEALDKGIDAISTSLRHLWNVNF